MSCVFFWYPTDIPIYFINSIKNNKKKLKKRPVDIFIYIFTVPVNTNIRATLLICTVQ